MNLFLNSDFMHFGVAFLIWVCLAAFIIRSWIDWDSASHLYWAFLKHKRIEPIATYFQGCKWLLPRLYTAIFKLIEHNIKYFRLPGLLYGLISYLFIINLFKDIPNIIEVGLIFIIFSTYFKVQSSTSEWWITHTLIIGYCCINIFGLPWTLMVLLVIICAILFKIIDILYLLPASFLWVSGLTTITIHDTLLLVVSSIFLYMLGLSYYRNAKSFKSYAKTRSIFSKKNLRYILMNPLLFVWLGYGIYTTTESNAINIFDIFLFASIVIMLLQKSLHQFLLYSVTIFMTLIALSKEFSDLYLLSLISLAVFNWILCVIAGRGDIEVGARIIHEFEFGRRDEVRFEKDAIARLTSLAKLQKSVHFYGSRMSLPLLARLVVNVGKPYSSNHSDLWQIKAEEELNMPHSKFIVVCKEEFNKITPPPNFRQLDQVNPLYKLYINEM